MTTKEHPQVKKVFESYPTIPRKKLLHLRKLILDVASRVDGIEEIEEVLKWGEPSYVVKKGSTIRIAWKEATPMQYAIYFKCTSKLVETFRILYGATFSFEKNRAIVFNLEDKIPELELKICILAALTYHKVKHLPNLGIEN